MKGRGKGLPPNPNDSLPGVDDLSELLLGIRWVVKQLRLVNVPDLKPGQDSVRSRALAIPTRESLDPLKAGHSNTVSIGSLK